MVQNWGDEITNLGGIHLPIAVNLHYNVSSECKRLIVSGTHSPSDAAIAVMLN